ncbi:Na+/H+ antiporter NhaC [Elysia marginata]|uniref:Na+/H+ antiporter NhaC n=1 Tax=Elysia marginata TaxID=1093978 RepID=A0AAV4I214_9GAST|nr:Na+/H+ antiporter NhaC [Elysia marginata]
MIEGKQLRNNAITLFESLVPIIVLIGMLSLNVYLYGDESLGGANQFALIVGGVVAAVIGMRRKISYDKILKKITSNIESTSGAILILLFVGALSGTWLVSGIIPSMIYYGTKLLNPTLFLPATLLISSVTSLATGSSWTTSATVGVALIGIGDTLGVDIAMTAGAVISGAYFGDKLSPLSETTNLAPAIAGTTLYDHIKYLTFTTMPTYLMTLSIFFILGLFISTPQEGKMFKNAFDKKGLAPENLSRTLEDSGTVTSALIPWNTCGAYHSSVLGVPTLTYLPFAFFNIISPIMTLIYAYFKIKIKYQKSAKG